MSSHILFVTHPIDTLLTPPTFQPFCSASTCRASMDTASSDPATQFRQLPRTRASSPSRLSSTPPTDLLAGGGCDDADDPATRFRLTQRTSSPSRPSSPSSTDMLALGGRDGEDDDAELMTSSFIGSSHTYRSSAAFGQSVKRARHSMSSRSTADFDSFLKVCLCI